MGMEQKIERTEQYAHFAASQVPIRPKKVIYNERGITGIDRIMFGVKGVGIKRRVFLIQPYRKVDS